MPNFGIDNSPAHRVVSVDADGNPIFGSAGAGSNVNVADINGVTPLMGAGNTGTGSQRVTIASDQAALPITTVIPGTAATNLGKAEDAIHSSGDVGIMNLGVGNVAQTTLASDGDYIPHAVDTAGNILTVGNVASAATDSGNPVKIGGKYLTSAPTLTNGQRGDAQLDVNANIKVTLATILAASIDSITAYPFGHSFLNIAAGQATTTVKSGAGVLHSITLNSAATATNTTTVYDNTAASGTVIAIPAATTATVPVTLTYDIAFSTGLTIITATANGSNMTVSYR